MGENFKVGFSCFSKIALFVKSFEFKIVSLKSQNLQKPQNNILTKHRVILVISKSSKIRDQGMEIDILMLCFKNMYPWCILKN